MIFVDAQQNHTNGIQLNSNLTFSSVTDVVTSDYVGYEYLATPQYFVQTPAVNSFKSMMNDLFTEFRKEL